MAVEIVDVKRVEGKAVSLAAWIGDIESRWIRGSKGKPYEINRVRAGVQVLDQDTLSISRVDYLELKRKVETVFGEDRSESEPRLGIQGKLL